MRGSRIQSIVRELNGEKIDIINWSDKPEILISRALAPAKPINLYIDEERPYVVAVFEDEELPMAIGKNGQNIKLASGVTDYSIDAVKKSDYEINEIPVLYIDEVEGISSRYVEILSKAEIHTADDFLSTESDYIVGLKGLGDKTYDRLKDLINNALEIHKELNKDKINKDSKEEIENIEI